MPSRRPGCSRNLLYYIAASGANSRYIGEIKQAYNLAQALPEAAAFADDEVAASIKAALAQQLLELADNLGTGNAPPALLGAVKRAQDTTALLGMSAGQLALRELGAQLRLGAVDTARAVPMLRQLADGLELAQRPNAARPLFNDSEEAQEQLDKAFDAIMRESRNSLEQAKEAIIEFVATQWRHQSLEEVPELLAGVRGSFAVAGLHRAADVLAACETFVRIELLEQRKIPAWQLLDTLADAIASVDYYLERLSEDTEAECERILTMAEQSVAALALAPAEELMVAPPPVSAQVLPFQRPGADRCGRRTDRRQHAAARRHIGRQRRTPLQAIAETEPAPVAFEVAAFDPPVLETEEFDRPAFEIPELADSVADTAPADLVGADDSDDEDGADPEIVEIFIEEAGEVLDTIHEYLAPWSAKPTTTKHCR